MTIRIYLYFVILLPLTVFAQLSPGKLHNSHAELEGLTNCKKCHGTKQQIRPESCLACHKLLAEQISKKAGLHGKKGYDKCEVCHVEHHGRDYQLVYWPEGKDNFEHAITGYVLEGKHKKLKCDQCHQAKNIIKKSLLLNNGKDLEKTFLGLNRECLSCHTDEHRQQMDSKCLNCHSMDNWIPAPGFDHNKTQFNLTGRHKNTACDKCHAHITDNKYHDNTGYSKYKNIPHNVCTDCHQDFHNNKFGRDCQKCHSTLGWRQVNQQAFDHSRTRYPLKGKHVLVNCQKCHPPGRSTKIVRYQKCSDCHINYHIGQFKTDTAHKDCQQCHTVDGFSPSTFSLAQHEQTNYPLKGGHLATPCVLCHTKLNGDTPNQTTRFRFGSTQCQECHKNPHGNQVEKYLTTNGCEYCHHISSWRNVSFDHTKTKYPLTGRHQAAQCSGCHVAQKDGENVVYQFMAVETNCQNCHDDIHYGQFKFKILDNNKSATDCSRCHTTIDWLAEKFDHNSDSRFKIDGAHQFVKCGRCHPNIVLGGKTFRLYRLLRTECSSCHGTKKPDSEK